MRGFQLQRERGDAVAQLRVLPSEGVGFDLIQQAQVEQPVLLVAQHSQLALNVVGRSAGFLLLVVDPQAQHFLAPIAHRLGLLDPREQRQDPLVQSTDRAKRVDHKFDLPRQLRLLLFKLSGPSPNRGLALARLRSERPEDVNGYVDLADVKLARGMGCRTLLRLMNLQARAPQTLGSAGVIAHFVRADG